jgi:hypothetical protein
MELLANRYPRIEFSGVRLESWWVKCSLVTKLSNLRYYVKFLMYSNSMAKSSDRGIINTVKLKSAIVLNGHKITKAIIELDHINYGLNSKTKKLNTAKRSNFSNSDIEKFIMLLDG